MGKLLLLTSALLWPGAAMAQAGDAPAGRSDVTVRAPERLVCRNVTRTATRMRTSRTCRPVSEANNPPSQDEELARAADNLEVMGEKVSTGCTGGMGGGATGGAGPY